MTFSAIIVAAGSGERAGAGGPKQWRPLAGRAVARWSLEALIKAGAKRVVVVVSNGGADDAARAFAGLEGWSATVGGAARADSVKAGLDALGASADDVVLIHDAARPFLQTRHVEALINALATADGAAPALPVADTLKRRDANGSVTTATRDGLWRAQTPQAFRATAIAAGYAAWPIAEAPTDDLAVVERAGGRVVFTPGDPMLFKLTYPEDFDMAERLARSQSVTRIGQGFDVHQFGEGDGVWLCGVRIEHGRSLVGHSDADAGLHALTDALLGAIGEGDIGDHFPPTDPQWRGADSAVFLCHAVKLVAARGGVINNVDVTLVCEAPKIKPHRQAMRARLAELLDLAMDQVSVKATTTERLGFTGRGEGLAAQAAVSITAPL